MKISLIICTRNRASALDDCLTHVSTAIRAQKGTAIECVIVNNGSTDNTHDVIENFKAQSDFPVKNVFESSPGLSNARNAGIRNASGEIFAFTDDDCHIHPDFFAALLRHDAADGQELVLRGGAVHLGCEDDLPLTIKSGLAAQRFTKRENSARKYNLGNALLGANMIMRRSLQEKIGFFDTALGAGSPIPSGEDTDYIMRAYILDIPIEWVPDIIVDHYHGRKKAEDGRNLLKSYSYGSGALYIKHWKNPDFARQLYWDLKNLPAEIFLGRRSYGSDCGFHLRHNIWYILRGSLRYLALKVRTR